MKAALQQEIIIVTGTSFSSRQCFQKRDGVYRISTEKEYLQEACWDGLLPLMLPEICQWAFERDDLYLWHVKENKSGIEVDLGDAPGVLENVFSIDPYAFMNVQIMN